MLSMRSANENDARIPVHLDTETPGPAGPWAYLIEAGAPLPPGGAAAVFLSEPALGPHPAGCACCQPRSAAARALAELFARRARGEVTFFVAVRVVARTQAGRDAVAAAVRDDALLQARFRLASVLPGAQGRLTADAVP